MKNDMRKIILLLVVLVPLLNTDAIAKKWNSNKTITGKVTVGLKAAEDVKLVLKFKNEIVTETVSDSKGRFEFSFEMQKKQRDPADWMVEASKGGYTKEYRYAQSDMTIYMNPCVYREDFLNLSNLQGKVLLEEFYRCYFDNNYAYCDEDLYEKYRILFKEHAKIFKELSRIDTETLKQEVSWKSVIDSFPENITYSDFLRWSGYSRGYFDAENHDRLFDHDKTYGSLEECLNSVKNFIIHDGDFYSDNGETIEWTQGGDETRSLLTLMEFPPSEKELQWDGEGFTTISTSYFVLTEKMESGIRVNGIWDLWEHFSCTSDIFTIPLKDDPLYKKE